MSSSADPAGRVIGPGHPDFERVVDEIAEAVVQRRGCQGCQAGHGGPRNCEPSRDQASWLAEAGRAIDAILEAGAARISTKCRLAEDRVELARKIDHTLLKPDATKDEFQKLCEEAARFGFWSVCIHPAYVSFCRQLLEGTGVKICTVIGFPHGANAPEVKAFEAEVAQRDGAVELDMVVNVGALKSKEFDYVAKDIAAVRAMIRPGNLLKVILETSLLKDDQIVKGCEIARDAGAHFVKTSTGFASGGATASDIALMRRIVGDAMGVKASGGIRDAARADLMVKAGADRIGASASVAIVEGGVAKTNY